MRVLILGSGGREHALAWKIAQSPECELLICAPGNPGMARVAKCLPVDIMDNAAVVALAQEHEIDLVIPGPEAPLCNGVVDALQAAGIAAFGPTAAAAEIEGSKAFAKDVMLAASVRTAEAQSFSDPDAAWTFAQAQGAPLVIKADGLAAGKGVTICDSLEQARRAIDESLREKAFGESGESVLIEQFLDGEECSVFGLSDGENIITLVTSQDHKRIGDGDTGPNTGGMGAYSPAPVVDDAALHEITETVLRPVINEMRKRGTPFVGFLYAGLMMCEGDAYVIEFNCRFGDPECQVVMPRMRSDLLPVIAQAANGGLGTDALEWKDVACATVVLASGGYPGSYAKGLPIAGLDTADTERVVVFHAGTAQDGNDVVTNGGRVLAVTAWAGDLREALDAAYGAAEHIQFEGKYHRRDIGHRALARAEA